MKNFLNKKNKPQDVVVEEESEKDIPLPIQTTEDDSIVVESEELTSDLFRINASGHFDEEDIFEIELPKFVLKNSIKGVQEIDEKSNITIVFKQDETNPDIGKRLLGAIKEGFKKFEIYFIDADDEVTSTWEFKEMKIRGVDFGNLMRLRKEPRMIHCELEYDYFSIDNETIS